MAQQLTIRLSRHDAQPWGFRLQGGKDFGTPLIVQKVNGGSLAEQAGLLPGDAVIRINNFDVFTLRHKDAQDIVVRSGNNFDVTVQRGGSTWRPHVTPTGALPTQSSHMGNTPMVTRTSLAHKPQEVHHIGSGYNNAARPFSAANGSDGQVKSIVNKQYNSPVGIYSEEAIAETLSAQAEVLAGGVLGVNFKKNEKVYNAANSEVLKFLHEQENEPQEQEPHAPQNFFWTASHAIGGRKSPMPIQQHHQQQQRLQQSSVKFGGDNVKNEEKMHLQQNTFTQGTTNVSSLSKKSIIQSSLSSTQEQSTYEGSKSITSSNINQIQSQSAAGSSNVATCGDCGVGIVGVFVRIKDKNLHVDCFKCATCGTSLKNQGYFNLNNKLYCDIHAKLAALNNPPPGTDGYLPVPIKPGTKLSANTISAALSAHHFQSNGTSHLIAQPTSNAYTNYVSAPKPFGVSPKSPTLSGPKSPATYSAPSSQTLSSSNWSSQQTSINKAQAAANNPYATLPRTGAGVQGRVFNTYKPSGYNTFNRGLQQPINNNNTYKPTPSSGPAGFKPPQPAPQASSNINPSCVVSDPSPASAGPNKGGTFGATSAPKRGRGILNKAVGPGVRIPLCGCCNTQIRGPFITALGRIWCPDHFVCVNANCRRALQDIGFVEEKGELYCEYCFEKYLAPTCNKCNTKIKGDCLNAIGKHFHPECFSCVYCGKLFGNTPFFLEEGEPYCESDWNELFTTKCFACGFPVEAGDRWVEALNHNYHSQCFNCTMCKKNLEGQSFYNKGGRPFCKNHAR